MKIKSGFILREICGETVVCAESIDNFDFTRLISLNAPATYLWNELQGREFTPETVAGLLTDKYDVDHETALKDAEKLCESWKKAELLEA